MQLGFINFSQEELARKNKVLQMVREQTAIDELGFGRIRDAFANMMFRGMSTLQRRAKYFVVMPALFQQATRKHYSNIRDVKAQVTRWEVRLTEMLINGSNGDETKLTGITGRSMLEVARKDHTKFVKYDPTYIYMSGLRTFGMVKSEGNIYQLILDRSKQLAQEKPKYKASEEGEISDSEDRSGKAQLFACADHYDFDNGYSLSLDLTKREAEFLKGHITTSFASRDTLLAFILNNDIEVLPNYDDLADIWRTPLLLKGGEEGKLFWFQYKMGRRFSHYAYVTELRYNHIMERFNEQEEAANELESKIHKVIADNPEDFTPEALDELIDFVRAKVSEQTVITFTKKAGQMIINKQWTELDDLIIKREKAVKPGRAKLLNPKKKGEIRVEPTMLSFRWNEIVYRVITEIREAIK